MSPVSRIPVVCFCLYLPLPAFESIIPHSRTPKHTLLQAMLQYCVQAYSPSSYDDDEGVVFSFHWGGRPIVIETVGDYFSAELVLATLHHGMIT